jgi:hypothetical protein
MTKVLSIGNDGKLLEFTPQISDISGLETALAGKASTTHAISHKFDGSDAIKLDELAAPTDVTTLNASIFAHGLLPKLPNDPKKFFNGAGTWETPTGLSVSQVIYKETRSTATTAWTVTLPVASKAVRIKIYCLNSASSASNLTMAVNGVSTGHRQFMYGANGASLAAGESADTVVFGTTAGQTTDADISLSISGSETRGLVSSGNYNTSSDLSIVHQYMRISQSSDISTLTFTASQTNGIGTGSYIIIERVDADSGGVWGGITGTLSNQTDLQNALNAKSNLSGGNAFSGAQIIDTGTGALPAELAASVLRVSAADGNPARIEGLTWGANGLILRARSHSGTRASPAATASDVNMFAIAAFGHDGTNYITSQNALFGIFSDGVWSGTNRGTYYVFAGTPNGGTTNTTWLSLRNGCAIVGTDPGGSESLRVGGAAKFSGTATASKLYSTAILDAGTANKDLGGSLNVVADFSVAGKRSRILSVEDRSFIDWELITGGRGKFIFGTDYSGRNDVFSINTSTSVCTVSGTLTVTGKITTVSAVPASFADLAAVQTWLATQFT